MVYSLSYIPLRKVSQQRAVLIKGCQADLGCGCAESLQTTVFLIRSNMFRGASKEAEMIVGKEG